MAQVSYQEVGEQVSIARPSEALHKLRALMAAVRVVETYGGFLWKKLGSADSTWCTGYPPPLPSPWLSLTAVSIDLTHELTQVLLQQTQPTDSRGGTTIAMLYANW